MKINRNNYEVFFLDYYEGRLSSEQVNELMAFLDLHYDLKEEFESFENICLTATKEIIFEPKDSLKKPTVTDVGAINKNNYEEFFIADIEGDLSSEQEKELSVFLEKNPSLIKEMEIFRSTIIEPDTSISFPQKESLKRKEIIASGGINEINYTEHFIASFEGDLSTAELDELKEFLSKNPGLRNEYELFGRTKISADSSIVFDRKQLLKKSLSKGRVINLKRIYFPVSIAASISILFGIYLLLSRETLPVANPAERAEINFHRKVYHKENIQSGASTPAYSHTYANTNSLPKNNQATNISEHYDLQYASVLKPKEIGGKKTEDIPELKKINVYSDYLARVQKKNMSNSNNDAGEKEFLSLGQFAMYKIKQLISPEDKKDKVSTDDPKLTLWDVADAGISKFNNVTGSNARLERNKDNSYTFALGNNFEISGGGRSDR